MSLQGQRKTIWEQDVTVLVPLALLDKNLAGVEVDVLDPDGGQLRDADGGVKEQPQHDLVLKIPGLVDDLVEPLETGFRQDAGQPAGGGRLRNSNSLRTEAQTRRKPS